MKKSYVDSLGRPCQVNTFQWFEDGVIQYSTVLTFSQNTALLEASFKQGLRAFAKYGEVIAKGLGNPPENLKYTIWDFLIAKRLL